MILNEPTNRAALAQVIAQGYASDLDYVELLALTRDPFLIAAALLAPGRLVSDTGGVKAWKSAGKSEGA